MVIVIVFVLLFLYFVPVGLWVTAIFSGVRVGLGTLIGMRLRKVQPGDIVRPPARIATPTPRRIRNSPTPSLQEAHLSDAANAATAPQSRGKVRSAALSRTVLRQAVLLKEILGAPKALQPPSRSTIT
jgi:hypothetical protein